MARVALCATLVASGAALAAPKAGEARVQFDRGVAAYTKGDYAAAAEALGASFVLESDPETLFAWAQTERKLGHCDRAIDLYGKLLAMDLPAENKQAIRVQIGECKAIIADQKAAKPADKTATKPADRTATKPADKSIGTKPADKAATKPADKATKPADKVATKPADKSLSTKPPDKAVDPSPVETPPIEQPPIDTAQVETLPPVEEPKPLTSEGRAWWKEPVGGSLVGAGAIGIGVGIVFLAQASAADSDKANEKSSYDRYTSLADRAESRGRLGVIGLVAGGALATAGIVWYVTHKPSSERTVTTLVLPSGGGVAFSGRF